MKKRAFTFILCLSLIAALLPGSYAGATDISALLCKECATAPCVCQAEIIEESQETEGPTCLTIAVNGSFNKGQSFLFKITGADYEAVVALPGGKDVCIDGLTVGNSYTVEPLSKWAWRYTISPGSASVTIQADSSRNVLAFSVSKSNYNWLSSDSYRVF